MHHFFHTEHKYLITQMSNIISKNDIGKHAKDICLDIKKNFNIEPHIVSLIKKVALNSDKFELQISRIFEGIINDVDQSRTYKRYVNLYESVNSQKKHNSNKKRKICE
jgi:hypothetical protein